MPQSDVSQKNTNLGKPLDPTTNFQNYTGGDQYGLTGVTAQSDDQEEDKEEDLEEALQTDADSEDGADVLSLYSDDVEQKFEDILRADSVDGDELDDGTDGSESVSGDMPDPEADDNTLDMSHQMGLRLDEDEDTPKELNIAADVAAAERSRRGMDNDDDDDDL